MLWAESVLNQQALEIIPLPVAIPTLEKKHAERPKGQSKKADCQTPHKYIVGFLLCYQPLVFIKAIFQVSVS